MFLMDKVGEIYFGGYVLDLDEVGCILLIDVYDWEVDDVVWIFYEKIVVDYGVLLILIEWDNDVLEWLGLLLEVEVVGVILVRVDFKWLKVVS